MKLTGIKVGNTAQANRIQLPDGTQFWVPQSVCSEIRYNSNTGVLKLEIDDWWWEKREKESLPDDSPKSNFQIDL